MLEGIPLKVRVLWICSLSVISSKIILNVLANSTKREKKCYKQEHTLNNNMITRVLLGLL